MNYILNPRAFGKLHRVQSFMTVYDHLYGKHSRIPGCCRRFYRRKWHQEYLLHTPYARTVHLLNWGYVPCPLCVAQRNQIKVRICECDCPHECRELIEQALQKYLIAGRLTRGGNVI